MSSLTPQQKTTIAIWVVLATVGAVILAMTLADPLLGVVLG